MAKIQTPNRGMTISVILGANYYRLGPGLEVTRASGTGIVYDMVVLNVADRIILDRDWCHGTEAFEETNTCALLSGATNVAVINSYLNNFKCNASVGSCTDGHAISGGDGIQTHAQGTWKILGNFLEASGENIMFGGGGNGNGVPVDIESRENHLYKPPSWRTCTPRVNCYVVKNLFELKNGGRVLFEDNLLEGSWGGYTQTGYAVLLIHRGPWAHVEDVVMRYNPSAMWGIALH